MTLTKKQKFLTLFATLFIIISSILFYSGYKPFLRGVSLYDFKVSQKTMKGVIYDESIYGMRWNKRNHRNLYKNKFGMDVDSKLPEYKFPGFFDDRYIIPPFSYMGEYMFLTCFQNQPHNILITLKPLKFNSWAIDTHRNRGTVYDFNTDKKTLMIAQIYTLSPLRKNPYGPDHLHITYYKTESGVDLLPNANKKELVNNLFKLIKPLEKSLRLNLRNFAVYEDLPHYPRVNK